MAPLPRNLALIVATALRKDPAARYPSAEHFADDVQRFLEHRPLRRQRQSPWQAIASQVRRRPLAAAAVIGLASLLLGGLIAAISDLARVRASESLAWRAHSQAVQSTNLLAELLERIGTTSAREELAEPLRAAEAHLDRLESAPEAEARLRLALARVQLRLGLDDTAEVHLRRSLALARSTRGLSWRDADQCLDLLIEQAIRRGDTAAVSMANERLRERAAHGADPSPAVEQSRRAAAMR